MEEEIYTDEVDHVAQEEDEVSEDQAGEMESYFCAFCGEENELFVDRTAARHQQFTEDCDVCCRPNLITVSLEADGSLYIDAEQEDEA